MANAMRVRCVKVMSFPWEGKLNEIKSNESGSKFVRRKGTDAECMNAGRNKFFK